MDPITLTFPCEATFNVACTNIRILDDDSLEGDHSFTVILSSVELSNGPYPRLSIGEPSSAIVTIFDNEGMAVS